MKSQDNQIESQGQSILNTNPFLAQQKLSLAVQSGHVVLSGVVHSFYQKQMAQEALRQVDGIKQIDNNVEVSWG